MKSIWRVLEKLSIVVKQCYQTDHIQWDKNWWKMPKLENVHTISQYLKIAKNVSFDFFFNFGVFHQFLTHQKGPVWWHCFQITKNVVFAFFYFGIFHHFSPTKDDLSGNTVRPQVLGCQNSSKLTIFGIFNNLCPLEM